jgi:hypothetical protein
MEFQTRKRPPVRDLEISHRQRCKAMIARILFHPYTAHIITLIGLLMLSVIPSCAPALPGVLA